MIRRTSKILLEVIGVAVAVTAVLLAFLAWRLSTGPISLPILSQILEDAVSAELEGGKINIGDTILRWSPDSRQLGLRVLNVAVVGADGNTVATLPQLSFRLSVPGLLRGTLAPTRVDLYNVTATLVRRPTGISLGLASAAGSADAANAPATGGSGVVLGPMLDTLANGKADVPVLAYLRRLGIHNATLRVDDQVNGVTFEAPNANLSVYRGSGGLAANLQADVILDNETGHIDLEGALPSDADFASVKMKTTNIVPAALARMSPAFHNWNVTDAPMSATGDLEILRDGRVRTARLEIEAGKGQFTIPGLAQAPVKLEKAHASLTLDALARRVEVKDLTLQAGPHSITMTGSADYVLGEGLNVSTLGLDLSAGKTTTEIAGVFEGPVTFDNAHFVGTIDFDNRQIDVKKVTLGVAGGEISAQGVVGEGERSPALKATATIGKIPVNEARAAWPLFLSPKSRVWVAKNMKDGDLLGGKLYIDVPADMLADNEEYHLPIPDGHLRFEFSVSGATVNYLDGMPPLQNVVAHGLVANNTFNADVSSAFVAVAPDHILKVTGGHFEDTNLAAQRSIGIIKFKGNGKTADILSLLDHEPLKLIGKFGLDPTTVGGTGSVDATLHLPLVKDVTIDQVDFAGTAHADDVSIPNIQPNLSITTGTLDVDLTRAGLKAVGKVGLNGATPLNLTWTERFTHGKGPSSTYKVSGTTSNDDRNAIGLKFDKFLTGPAIIAATLTGSGADINHADIHADLTPSVVHVNYLGWTKPADKPASVDVALDLVKDGYQFRNFKLSGPEIDAHGKFDMNKTWDWMMVDLPTVKLGPDNDLALKGARNDKGTLTVNAIGPRANASGLLHDFVSGNGDKAEAEAAATRLVTPEMVADPARRTDINATIAHVTGQNDTSFSDLTAHFSIIDDWVYSLSIKGKDSADLPISASITPAENQTRKFAMSSADAGAIFRTLDLADGIRGGTMTGDGVFDDTQPGSPMQGNIDVRKFRLVNEPVLAKILTLGSLTGISDTLSGDGIYFDHLILPFRVTGHRIHVDEARVAGPAIGLTMKGQIDRISDQLDLEGTLVPAYTINSVLGKVPLLGPLLVGREGEGIFGLTYRVRGKAEDPSVLVNPLSAIAPGFLRRLFEFGSSLPPEAPLPVAPPASSAHPADAAAAPETAPKAAPAPDADTGKVSP